MEFALLVADAALIGACADAPKKLVIETCRFDSRIQQAPPCFFILSNTVRYLRTITEEISTRVCVVSVQSTWIGDAETISGE